MGFYHGSHTPPPKDEKEGGIAEALAITWVVFRVLALPLGIIFGGIIYLFIVFWLFSIHPLLGLAGILVVVGALVARGVWEAKHPPELP
jgi:hypothetical protein